MTLMLSIRLSTWYESHIYTLDFEIYGHYIAGIPFALLGAIVIRHGDLQCCRMMIWFFIEKQSRISIRFSMGVPAAKN